VAQPPSSSKAARPNKGNILFNGLCKRIIVNSLGQAVTLILLGIDTQSKEICSLLIELRQERRAKPAKAGNVRSAGMVGVAADASLAKGGLWPGKGRFDTL